MRVIVTGGAGFIGSALVRHMVTQGNDVLNIDKLTYAGDLRSVDACSEAPNYHFLRADITDSGTMFKALADFSPDAVFHLAAETHVDRSIDNPHDFVATNVMGTYVVLESALRYWRSAGKSPSGFRLVAVSTDEVFGTLGSDGLFSEITPYAPSSPYAANKAAADHLARACHQTFQLPVIVTNCSNNYGPFQYPEKLIPTVIRAALEGREIPIYGNGTNVRDWLHVDDHVCGLLDALVRGEPGRSYNFGGESELTNVELVARLCALLDKYLPLAKGSYADQIVYVPDRPGHDFPYAIDCSRAEKELGWTRRHSIDSGLDSTVRWYLQHRDWLTRKTVPSG